MDGKYFEAEWGGKVTLWRFDAVKDGQVIASQTRGADAALHLEVRPSSAVLTDGDTWDMAAVRIRVADPWGNTVPYAQLPLRFAVTGAAALVGPDVICAEGGMGAAYLRTVGRAGTAVLTVRADGLEDVAITFDVINNKP